MTAETNANGNMHAQDANTTSATGATSNYYSLLQFFRVAVYDSAGEQVGTIDDVLFHPTKPIVVGFSVKPLRVGGVVPLPVRYLRQSRIRVVEGGQIHVIPDEGQGDKAGKKASKSAWGTAAEREQSYLWEETVIYLGQDVKTVSGEDLGKISDLLFSPESGKILKVKLGAGAVNDIAQGTRTIEGSRIYGFSLENFAVMADDRAAMVELSGGATKAAKELGDQALHAAVKGAATATVYTQRGVEKALQTEAGKKAKSIFRQFKKDMKDALKDED